MAEWVYEARTRAGEIQTGVLEANDEDEANSKLRARQLNPVKVKKKPREFNITLGTGVKTTELVVFTRQFATMIDAGLPLVQCLDILSTRGENKALKKILADVKTHVEGGSTFSDGLARHPKLFDELFVNLIRAGEMGGILDTILNRLAIYIEKRGQTCTPGSWRHGLSGRNLCRRHHRCCRDAQVRYPELHVYVR